MSRAILAGCAGVGVALLLAGCANSNLTGLFFAQGDSVASDGVVAGKLEVVATATQDKLSRLGFAVALTHEGEAIHLTSATRSGAAFTLVMTREQTSQGEQTRLKLKWGNGYDREAAVQILSEVAPKTGR